jgi:hypothetical protein
LNIDEGFFEAFCPQSLKDALLQTAEINLPRIPSYKGLDIASVLKLVAVLAMIGVMAGTSIVPQAQVVVEAGDALCGTLRGTRGPCAVAWVRHWVRPQVVSWLGRTAWTTSESPTGKI